MYNILVIGAVGSTKATLSKLIQYNFNIVGVMGHEPKNKNNVSGWCDLKEIAFTEKLPYKGFEKINDTENLEWAKAKKIDVIFAVGFSQLMSENWLNLPTLGCIGFHPTLLPKGRGRAPLAWIILEKTIAAASFFLMGVGADDGPIFVQKTFRIKEEDDAFSVKQKIESSINLALDEWLPNLKKGIWSPQPQQELLATWYGKRSIEDGLINWHDTAHNINRLVKASTYPYPGAYTYFQDQKIKVLSSRIEFEIKIKGVIGRVLLKNQAGELLIQCGDGLIWINEYDKTVQINVGNKLGYNIEDEIFKIKQILKTYKYE